MKKMTDQVATFIFLPLFLSLGLAIFAYVVIVLGAIAKENQTYDRYNSCVLSVPALQRDQDKIDRCYYRVQEDTGKRIKRYDKD